MRKRISERNNFPDFDLYNEYSKIDMLLSEKKVIGVYNKHDKFIPDYFTLEEYIQYVCFNDWNLRGTFISIQEMRSGLGIAKESLIRGKIDENIVLDFLQYALNCVYRVSYSMKNAKKSLFSDDTIITMLWENIEKLIDKLNCVPKFDKDQKEVFIMYKNATVTVVANECTDIEDSVTEYVLIDNRGDLKRKAEILCTLYKKLEAYSDLFKGTTYKNMYEDTKLLFNKSGVRHNVEKDRIACATFMAMNDSKLENWYDKIFNMFLSCVVIAKYLDDKKEIDDIKRGIA